MNESIKRADASEIIRKLNEAKNSLIRGNIFSCLISFREVLEKMLTIKMLPSDEKELQQEINAFQKNLSSSSIFLEVYGPVTFRDNEISTALAFLKQLILVKEEETRSLMETAQTGSDETADSDASKIPQKAHRIKIMIEKGDYTAAQEAMSDDEELMSQLVHEYNKAGIEHRRAGRYDAALSDLRKALVVHPHDEGLFYNLARVYIDKTEWQNAAEAINEGMKINHNFTEGMKLLKYIRENME